MTFLGLFLLFAIAVFVPGNGLHILNAKRSIDITNSLIETTLVLTLKNPKAEVDSFLLDFHPEFYKRLTHFECFDKYDSTYTHEMVDKEHAVKINISLPRNEKKIITIKHYQAGALTPYPESADILPSNTSIQLVHFKDTYSISSKHKVDSEETTITIGRFHIERVHPQMHVEQFNGQNVALATYTFNAGETPPAQEIYVHFGFLKPLAELKSVTRNIDVSPWRDVHFHELYWIHNNAAKPSESFNRASVHRMGASPQSHILFGLNATLPFDTHGVQIYDKIGNVSTSLAAMTPAGINIFMAPRFPLMGGWGADLQMEYNIPKEKLSKSDGQLHVLSVPISAPFGNIQNTKVVNHITLPPFAVNPKIISHGNYAKNIQITKKAGWLDIITQRTILTFDVEHVSAPTDKLFTHTIDVQYEQLASPWISSYLFIAIIIFVFVGISAVYSKINRITIFEEKPKIN